MGNEEDIHDLYEQFKRRGPPPRIGGVSNPANRYSSNTELPRWNLPSFRSKWFDTGNGLVTIAPGKTEELANKNVPVGHLGILTGFTQFFADQDILPTIVNSVSWGIRINGMSVSDLPDFVGELSKSYLPRQVFFPLLGEVSGLTSTSPGGSPSAQVPTVSFRATNLLEISIVLSGRLIGYTFPIDERNDEFGAY